MFFHVVLNFKKYIKNKVFLETKFRIFQFILIFSLSILHLNFARMLFFFLKFFFSHVIPLFFVLD